ncbi:UNVERIFIED_CONTAM: hypothetical protein ACS92_01970 [Bacillus cereus]
MEATQDTTESSIIQSLLSRRTTFLQKCHDYNEKRDDLNSSRVAHMEILAHIREPVWICDRA